MWGRISVEDKFVYRIGSTTNHLGRPPIFYHNSHLSNGELQYASVYAVREEDANAIQQAGTAAGFRGIVWSGRLWIDLDTQEASEAARAKVKELGYDHVVYDTGNRGVHIGISRPTMPSHTLPQQDKAWVSANIVGADLSLYWHLHLIRLPRVVHEKTGRPKRLLESVQGKALALPPWRPEEPKSEGVPPQAPQGRKSIFSTWEVISNLTPTGHRRQLVELAVALCNNSKASIEEAMWVVKEVNRGFDVPKDEADIDRIIRWAYSRDQREK
jgi:hypothetical protein